MYVFCIVTVVRVHFVLWQRYVNIFCTLTVELVHVLYCDSGACACFVLRIWCVCVFCIVTVVLVHILYCDSGTREKKFEDN